MATLGEAVYWDSCIFYAHLKGEEHRAGELGVIRKQVAEFDAGSLVIATSVITITEVMPSKLTDEQVDLFMKMQERSNFVFIETNPQIALLAVKLRDQYAKPKGDGTMTPTLTTPDAIHVASAIAVNMSQLITLDSNDKPKKGELGLTKLSPQTERDYNLKIIRPDTKGQFEMDVSDGGQRR